MSLDLNAIKVADEIIDMMISYGHNEYSGEKVTQLQHMYQAALLAESENFDQEVILAAFLHDIGHICVSLNYENNMDGYGVVDHEEIGSQFLKERGFSDRVVRLVSSHVDAKRYLTKVNIDYYNLLSDASKKTLEYQGGPMNDFECITLESDPYFKEIIKLRLWDDAAKIEEIESGDLGKYRAMIIEHLSK